MCLNPIKHVYWTLPITQEICPLCAHIGAAGRPTWPTHPHKSVGQPTPRFWPVCGMVWVWCHMPQCRSGVTYWYPCDPHFMPVQYRAAHPGQMCSTTHFTLHESIISKTQWTAQYRLHTGNQHGGLREVKLLWCISKIMLLSLSLEYLPCKYFVYCWVLCSEMTFFPPLFSFCCSYNKSWVCPFGSTSAMFGGTRVTDTPVHCVHFMLCFSKSRKVHAAVAVSKTVFCILALS